MRALDTADVGPMFELLRPLYAKPQFPLGGAWSERLLEQELERGQGWGAFDRGDLVAFVLARRQPQLLDVVILATRVDQHRRGHMAGLLQFILRAKTAETEVWLEVHEANLAAQNLYKKLGFRQVGHRPQYYRDGAGALLYNFR